MLLGLGIERLLAKEADGTTYGGGPLRKLIGRSERDVKALQPASVHYR